MKYLSLILLCSCAGQFDFYSLAGSEDAGFEDSAMAEHVAIEHLQIDTAIAEDAAIEICYPTTCESFGYTCGSIDDGCGNKDVCGPWTPGSAGNNSVCMITLGLPYAWLCNVPPPIAKAPPPFPDCKAGGQGSYCCAEKP